MPFSSMAAARRSKRGGFVIKNVTGFDLPKLMCGRVRYAGRADGVDDARQPGAGTGGRPSRFWTAAPMRGLPRVAPSGKTGGGCERAGPICRPKPWRVPRTLDAQGPGVAFIRVEGTRAAVSEKLALLRSEFADHELALLEEDRTTHPFSARSGMAVFSLRRTATSGGFCVPASQAYAALQDAGASFWYADWAGGLLWLEAPADEATAARMRGITKGFGGHAIFDAGTIWGKNAVVRVRARSAGTRRSDARGPKRRSIPKHILNPGPHGSRISDGAPHSVPSS